MAGTQAIILAAGMGGRLRPLTERIPKCLIPVAGSLILHRELDALQACGVSHVTIVVGFMRKAVERYVRSNFATLGVRFVHNQNFATTNTLYSLALAAEGIAGTAGVLLLNGDVVFDREILDRLIAAPAGESYLAVRPGRCGEEEVKVLLAEDGCVASLGKHIAPENAFGEAIGINRFSHVFWRALTTNLIFLKERHLAEYFEYAVEQTIAQGEKIFPFDIGKRNTIEIDDPIDLEKAQKIFTPMSPR